MVLKYKDGDLMNEKKIVLNEAQKMLVEKNLSIVQIVIKSKCCLAKCQITILNCIFFAIIRSDIISLNVTHLLLIMEKIFRLKDMQLLLYIIMFILRCRSISKRKKVLYFLIHVQFSF